MRHLLNGAGRCARKESPPGGLESGAARRLDHLGPELRERDDSLDQIPPQDEYDITKGFTYLYFGRKPQFTFGHVFSYTTFRYSELKMTPAAVAASGTVTVSLELQNTGAR